MGFDPIGMGQAVLYLKAQIYAGENKKLADCLNEIIYNPNYSYGVTKSGLNKWKLENKNIENFSEIENLVSAFFENKNKNIS